MVWSQRQLPCLPSARSGFYMQKTSCCGTGGLWSFYCKGQQPFQSGMPRFNPKMRHSPGRRGGALSTMHPAWSSTLGSAPAFPVGRRGAVCMLPHKLNSLLNLGALPRCRKLVLASILRGAQCWITSMAPHSGWRRERGGACSSRVLLKIILRATYGMCHMLLTPVS